MSGGLFDYHNDTLCEDICGVYPDYGLDTKLVKRRAAKAREFDRLEDAQISELVYDVFCLLHSFDWYRESDTDEEQYRKDVDYFKRKWFKMDSAVKVKEAIDAKLGRAKEELLKEFSYLMEDKS